MSLLLLSLLACWKPYDDLTGLDFTEVPYKTDYVNSTDAVVSAFDTTIDCPDGEPARFFAVYRTNLSGPAPVAVVLHSGAFDYVLDPDPGGYLDGLHYRGESRLSRGWAVSKVWETLGMAPGSVDPSESNLGTLPAALTDSDVVQLYPGNCWGDLWHNEEGYQDNEYEVEGFTRNGRTFAYWMIRALVEQDFAATQGFQIAVELDANQVYLIGLGSGGRGVAEILTHENLTPIKGVLLDSSPEHLSPYLNDDEVWAEEVEGISRIFREENLDTVDDYSILKVAADGGLPERTVYVWSDADPRQPVDTMNGVAESLATMDGTWVYNVGEPGHVFTNGSQTLARYAVDFLLQGTLPVSD